MKASEAEFPTIERLRALFSYDPQTGVLTSKVDRPKRPVGSVIGTRSNHGALICRVDYKILYVHRIVWMLFYGREPIKFIDHINGNPADNRIANLREASVQENGWNAPGKNGRLKGAHWSNWEQKWRSSINVNGTTHHLGWFDAKEDAAKAYEQASRKMHGAFSFYERGAA